MVAEQFACLKVLATPDFAEWSWFYIECKIALKGSNLHTGKKMWEMNFQLL